MLHNATIVLMLYHACTTKEVLDELGSSEKGLHQIYAEARLATYGYNQLKIIRTSLSKKLIEPFVSPIALILFCLLAVSIYLESVSSAILVIVALFVHVVALYTQRLSVDRTLRSVERHASGTVTVRRDNITARIDAIEIVPGDVVLLEAGARIPADGRVLHANELTVNESQLTGTSDPVTKHNRPVASESPLESRSNSVYRGAHVVGGSGVFVVTSTGNATEFGSIVQSLAAKRHFQSLQHRISRLTTPFMVVALLVGVAMLGLSLAHQHDLATSLTYLTAIIAATAPIALSLIVTFTMVYTIASLRKRHVLLRDLQSVELTSMLSAVCLDASSLLTKSELSFERDWFTGRNQREFDRLVYQSVLAKRSANTHYDNTLATHLTEYEYKSTPIKQFDFTHHTGMSGGLWHHENAYTVVVKGMPEVILHQSNLTESQRERATLQFHKMSSEGYKVLAIARAVSARQITSLSNLKQKIGSLEFVGFVVFRQQLVPEANSLVARLRTAGIKPLFVTGNHLDSAYYIAKKLGLASKHGQVVDARRLALLSDSEIIAQLSQEQTVFARATPIQKQRIVELLHSQHIVGATGTRADDVPSLFHADVGISPARSSTLAQDASEIILLNSRFSGLIDAIKWSRTALGNMQRILFYLFLLNAAELMLIVLSGVFNLPIALTPTVILWTNLCVGIGLALPLSLEPHSRHIMERPPAAPNAPMLPVFIVIRIVAIAGAMALVTLSIFSIAYRSEGLLFAQTLAFNVFVWMQIANAFIARSDHTSTFVRFRTHSPWLYLAVIVVFALHGLALWSPLAAWLGLTTLAPLVAVTSGAVGAMSVLVIGECSKWYSRHFIREKNHKK